MLTRGGILIRNPRLIFVIDPDNPGGGDEHEPKFPANTPVKDMTPEQQAAFHENKARRLEDKLKAFNGLTPEQVATLQQELADAQAASLSAEDKAIQDAKEAGRAEVRTILANERVKTALDRALVGRVPNTTALLELDRSQFVDGDKANTEAITAWVAANSTETAAPPRFPNLFQGPREHLEKSDRETGKAEAEKRFGKKS